MQSQRSIDTKTNFTEVRAGLLAGLGSLESRESTVEFEKMDLDELHSVQEELKRKMQTTNQLIESRSRSNSVRSNSSSTEPKGLISAAKLQEKHFKSLKDKRL